MRVQTKEELKRGKDCTVQSSLYTGKVRNHVRIQSRDPLGGGGRHEETGEAPHGHGHRCPLSEVGQGQQYPVPHHGGLACSMESLENLVTQQHEYMFRTGIIKSHKGLSS